MGEGLFDFLDMDLDEFVDSCLKESATEDPFPGAPDIVIPIVPVLSCPFELIDTTNNKMYSIETRSVNGSSPVWYLHSVWENYGYKEGTVGRKADILFHNDSFLDALRWHLKVLTYLNDSGF
ncbi:hypothetical protein KY338_04215 [Candidatus Woesearchaeota archaeon]|nr:hypothetical protein [Candidatus Woesearchaeota archaeon]MBW3005814.1 hypothetical protein [Candidatus Woesearchaeota archaeon]